MFNKEVITLDSTTSPYSTNLLFCVTDKQCGFRGLGATSLKNISSRISQTIFPIGMMIDYMIPSTNNTDLPDGWLLCDGSTFNATNHPELAAILGGNTLPNMQGRVTAMVERNNFGALANTSATTTTVGSTFGTNFITMTEAYMPAHNHPYSDTRRFGGAEFDTDKNDGGRAMAPKDDFTSTTKTTSVAGQTPPTAFDNRQPTKTVYRLIKAK